MLDNDNVEYKVTTTSKQKNFFPVCTTKLDSVNRITINKELRNILNVSPGKKLSIGYNRDGDLTLKPIF